MSLEQAFRVYNLVLLPFFFSLSTSSMQRKMWSVSFLLLQLGLPPTAMPSPRLLTLSGTLSQ